MESSGRAALIDFSKPVEPKRWRVRQTRQGFIISLVALIDFSKPAEPKRWYRRNQRDGVSGG